VERGWFRHSGDGPGLDEPVDDSLGIERPRPDRKVRPELVGEHRTALEHRWHLVGGVPPPAAEPHQVGGEVVPDPLVAPPVPVPVGSGGDLGEQLDLSGGGVGGVPAQGAHPNSRSQSTIPAGS